RERPSMAWAVSPQTPRPHQGGEAAAGQSSYVQNVGPAPAPELGSNFRTDLFNSLSATLDGEPAQRPATRPAEPAAGDGRAGGGGGGGVGPGGASGSTCGSGGAAPGGGGAPSASHQETPDLATVSQMTSPSVASPVAQVASPAHRTAAAPAAAGAAAS